MQDNAVKSVYIHIPFCKNICSYCDFCKNYYNSSNAIKYLNELKNEINDNYKGETLDTLYIGGGTPSVLSVDELNILKDIISIFKLNKFFEFTFECNYEDITEEKLLFLKSMKVNRISIGIESFNNKFSSFLNRKINTEEMIEKINLTKKYFDNISVDLMYGLKNQTINDIKNDLDILIDLKVNHISLYSLIIEENTYIYIKGIKEEKEDKQYEMYKFIRNYLKKYKYKLYEISNFSLNGFKSKHNITYWNNNYYYGFGLGASGFINDIRYTNTKSLNNYINKKRKVYEEYIDKNQMIKDEVMLNLRMKKGINKKKFYNKYKVNFNDLFDIRDLIDKKYLIENKNYIYIKEKYLFVSNEIILKIFNTLKNN